MRRHACWFVVVALLCAPFNVYAHKVATHQNITRAAVQLILQHDPQRRPCLTNLNNLLQIGTAAEDRLPRPLFHFLPRLDRGPAVATCSSEEWGFVDRVCTNSLGAFFPQTNDHTWDMALLRARDSSEAGLVELGYILHLLEDLTSPAHTRNDPHPLGDTDPVEALERDPSIPVVSNLIPFFSPQQAFNLLQQDINRDSTVKIPSLTPL
jgi:hypothetical protein